MRFLLQVVLLVRLKFTHVQVRPFGKDLNIRVVDGLRFPIRSSRWIPAKGASHTRGGFVRTGDGYGNIFRRFSVL